MPASLPRHLLLLLVAALLVPGAAAEDGQLTASAASYEGGAKLDGQALAFFLSEATSDESVAQSASDIPIVQLDIKAERLEALLVEQRLLLNPTAAGFTQPVPDPRYDGTQAPQRHVLDDAHAVLDQEVTGLQLHLLPADGEVLPFTADNDAGELVELQDLWVAAGYFGEKRTNDVEETRGDANPAFWRFGHDGSVVRHKDLGNAKLVFTGDMVLEVMGGTLDARDRDDQVTLTSGTWREPAAPVPGMPDELSSQRTVLLRVFLTGATVRVDVRGAGADVLLAGPDASAALGGVAHLSGASGQIVSDGDVLTLDNEPFTVPAGNVLGMRPGEGALALDVHPQASSVAGTAGGLGANGWPAQVALVAAALAVGAAVALALLRRSTHADLRAVEAAIEGGRYGRAARLAKRVLRHQPGLEDAVLGRAIALSKSGRAGAAIAELHEQLERHPATDGSLHYVLGLSLLDVGRVADARAALGEAVRLTPALAQDVQARLGTQGPSSSESTPSREVNGYA